jgi:phage-related protein (TIGR01555 family)
MWPFPPPAHPPARREPVLPPPARRSLRVTEAALMQVPSASAPTPAATYALPTPAPGVMPRGGGMAMDRGIEDLYGYAQAGTLAEGLAFLGYPYLSELAQRAEYRVASEVYAKEQTRRWVRLHASGDKAKNDKLTQLRDAMDRLGVQDVFREATEHDGLFGRGQILLDTGRSDDPDEMATPLTLTPAKVKKGGFKGLKAVEPLWTYPGGYSSTKPWQGDFYNPQLWYMQGQPIHATRLLGIVSRQVPDILKPAYMFGGLSLSQMAKPYVDNWLSTRQNVSDIIRAFSVWVLKTDMSAGMGDMAAGGIDTATATGLINRAEMFTRFATNRGLFMLDKDREDFANVSAPLGGLDHLQAQSQEHMAAIYRIPLTIFLGISPTGLNASSDGEIRVFYDNMESQRAATHRRPFGVVLNLLQLSEFGEIDPAIGFDFEPLWQMTETERGVIRKGNADTAAVYIEAGVLNNEEERERLAREDGGLYDGLDLSIVPEMPGMEDDGTGDNPIAGQKDTALHAALAGT